MSYTISPDSAIPADPDAGAGGMKEGPGAAGALPWSGFAQVAAGLPAGVIAVRAADVACPGGTAAMVATAGPVTSGEMLVFTHPVTVAPAVLGRGGVVRARGWLPDHVRLGELERHLGEGVIEDLVRAAVADGRMPAPQRMRLMSLGFTIRLMVAMTLMPETSYTEAIRRLAGAPGGCALRPGLACPHLRGGHRVARQGAAGGDGRAVLAGSRAAGRRRQRRRRRRRRR